jgi:signal transduction histidine kinase
MAGPIARSPAVGATGGRVRRVPIRIRLLAALAAPLVVLLAVVVAEGANTSREAQEQLDQTELAAAAVGPSGLMSALQDERNWAATALVGQEVTVDMPVEGYENTRSLTDGAIAEFRAELEAKGGTIAEAYAPALDVLVDLDQIRADIDADQTPKTLQDNGHFSNNIFQRYANVIAAFHQGNARLAQALDDRVLRQGAELVDVLARQSETSIQLEAAVIRSVLPPDPSISRDEIREIADFGDTFRRHSRAIATGARGPYREIVLAAGLDQWDGRVLAAADDAVEYETVDINGVLNIAAEQEDAGQSWFDLQDAVAEQLRTEADDAAAEARHRVRLFQLLALLAVIVTALTVWIVSRSITRPLRSLTAQARDMVGRRLPEAMHEVLDRPLGQDVVVPEVQPVAVTTRDEVADVAAAINTVQSSALGLAVEQAVLRRNIADSFVSLGRRNQHLLGRQLDFITELEVNETDPEVLANLFRLDHLATRMRRNAESLLLLAGVEPPRQWAAPVRITDAIRAALGEVEDYQRVVDRGVEPATVVGSAAADVAHLVAELIDNALIYSPPDQAVEIRGRHRPDGYTLAIIDAGLGMPPDELERANRRLAGAESFTIAPSKYLGHYVAGNLAARHDIHVALHNSPGHGITAIVTLPPTLLAEERVATSLRDALN